MTMTYSQILSTQYCLSVRPHAYSKDPMQSFHFGVVLPARNEHLEESFASVGEYSLSQIFCIANRCAPPPAQMLAHIHCVAVFLQFPQL